MAEREKVTQGVICPEGRFDAKVVATDLGVAGSGNPQVAISFGFVDSTGKQWNLPWYGTFSPNAIAKPKALIEPLGVLGWDADKEGWDPSKLARKSEENPAGGALIGREASLVVSHEDVEEKGLNGKYVPVLCDDTRKPLRRAVVQWINAPGGGAMMKEPITTKAGLANVASLIKAAAGGQQAPRPSTGASTGSVKTGAVAGANKLPF